MEVVKKMHADEVSTNADLVRELLTAQFPQWSDLPIRRVASSGTDNAIYRLGSEMAVRLPRINWALGQIEKEFRWMPKLAPQLPLTIPQPIVRGRPNNLYPYEWAVYRWIKGENLTVDRVADPCQAASDLAQFIIALQQIDTTDAPRAGANSRGASLKMRDEATRAAIVAMGDLIDANRALAVWEAALDAGEWEGEPVWYHGDLLIGNLLFEDGKLNAVIDFSGLAVGDPTCDLMIAWSLFAGESREVFRAALDVDDATWIRGRGHAMSQAVIFIPYYRHTNPVGVDYAQRMLTEIMKDFGQSRG